VVTVRQRASISVRAREEEESKKDMVYHNHSMPIQLVICEGMTRDNTDDMRTHET
jgi:hypothetical protein